MSGTHQLRNRILGSVIGGLILAFLLWFAGYIPAIWQAFKAALICLFRFSLSSMPIPIWLILLLSPLMIYSLMRMFSALKHKDDQKLDWRDYTDDEIMGMHWRWRYAPYNADIAKIWCFCPVDDTELIYQEGFSVSFPTVSFRCETCGAEFGPFNGDRHHVIGMAQRQIRLSFKLMSGKQLLSDCANMAEYCQKLLLSA